MKLTNEIPESCQSDDRLPSEASAGYISELWELIDQCLPGGKYPLTRATTRDNIGAFNCFVVSSFRWSVSFRFCYVTWEYLKIPIESTVFSLLSAGLHQPILMSSESSLMRPWRIYQKFELYPQHCVEGKTFPWGTLVGFFSGLQN